MENTRLQVFSESIKQYNIKMKYATHVILCDKVSGKNEKYHYSYVLVIATCLVTEFCF